MISQVDSLMALTHLAHAPSHNPSSNPLFSIFKSVLRFVPFPVFILFLLPFPYVQMFCILKSSYKWSHMMFVFLWLILFSLIPSSSIHVVANGKISFFLIAE